MSLQQWDKHADHMMDHIKWPATKKEIIAACQGEDVEDDVMEDLKMNLAEGSYNNSEEVKRILVK